MTEEKCPCSCGSDKKHYAKIGDDPSKWPSMTACDNFFRKVWVGEK